MSNKNMNLNQEYFLDFLKSENQHSNLIALVIREKEYSYADIYNLVSQAVHIIEEKNVCQKKIGVYLNDDIESYIAILAIWHTGNIYVPIHSSYPENRIQEIYHCTNLEGIFNAPLWIQEIRSISTQYWFIDRTSTTIYEISDPYHYKIDDICYCLFTSGSTGLPKGVQISYKNLSHFLDSVVQMKITLPTGGKYLQMFELTFDLSIVSFLLPLINNGTLYHVGSSSSKFTEVYRILEDYQIEFAIIVPSILTMLRPYMSEIELPSLKFLGQCGEAVILDTTMEFWQCAPNARFYNLYGPTECTIFCTSYQLTKENCLSKNGIVSIGKPIPHTSYHIHEENSDFLTPSKKGYLWIGGELVMPGYLNNEELNQQVLRVINEKNYYHTGDIVESDENGNLYFIGRADQQVKINGFRIEISEIEFNVKKILQTECAVINVKDKKGIDHLILCLATLLKSDHQNILTDLGKEIPKYMIPEEIMQVDEFPMNSNGKLDRKELKLMYERTIHQKS